MTLKEANALHEAVFKAILQIGTSKKPLNVKLLNLLEKILREIQKEYPHEK